MGAFANLGWAGSNKQLLVAVAKEVANGKLEFKCPLFGSNHTIYEHSDFWSFSYRNYDYALVKNRIERWNANFWTLCLLTKNEDSTKLKKIIMVREDFNVYLHLNFEGSLERLTYS